MAFGADKIMELLLASSEVTDRLDKFRDDNNEEHFAIYNDSKLPHNNELINTITFYRMDPIQGSLDYPFYEYRIACRSNDYGNSEDLGVAVFNIFNRYSQGGYVFKAILRETISNRDENDDQNTLVDVKMMINGTV